MALGLDLSDVAPASLGFKDNSIQTKHGQDTNTKTLVLLVGSVVLARWKINVSLGRVRC